jgi:hypothetical protein
LNLGGGRGWDRTSDLPRVKTARLRTVGDKRGRLGGFRDHERGRFPAPSPALLTNDSPISNGCPRRQGDHPCFCAYIGPGAVVGPKAAAQSATRRP